MKLSENQKFPSLDERLIKILEVLYPPLEYSQDTTQEAWAFRGGQREVISKLKSVYQQQRKGG
jgi:hypothetical protein